MFFMQLSQSIMFRLMLKMNKIVNTSDVTDDSVHNNIPAVIIATAINLVLEYLQRKQTFEKSW